MLRRFALGLSFILLTAKLSASEASPTVPADIRVIDQNGNERFFFKDLVGSKKAIVNFLYTSCERVCPPMGKKFKALQDKLGKRLEHEVVLISITMDPERDSPGKLKAWGETMGAGPGWTLVTGKRSDLDQLSNRILAAPLLEKNMHSPYIVLKALDEKWLPVFGLARTDEIIEKLGPKSRPSYGRQTPVDRKD